MFSDEETFAETEDTNTRSIFLDDATNCEDSKFELNQFHVKSPEPEHTIRSLANIGRCQTCPESSPYLKDIFKPGRIRRTRSHFQRAEDFFDSQDEETMSIEFSRKKQRNSIGTLAGTQDSMFSESCFNDRPGFYEVHREEEERGPRRCSGLSQLDALCSTSTMIPDKENLDPSLQLGAANLACQSTLSFPAAVLCSPQKSLSFAPPGCVRGSTSYSTPTRDEIMMKLCSINIEQQLYHLKTRLGIRVLAIDFDNTLLAIHTNGMWMKSAVALSNYVRPVFRSLIPKLLQCGIYVAIVSFSCQVELMERLVNICFPPARINENVFVCGGTIPTMGTNESSKKKKEVGNQLSVKMFFPALSKVSLVDDLALNKTGKCQHIETVLSHIQEKQWKRKPSMPSQVDYENILLIDDDKRNIEVCGQFLPAVKRLLFHRKLSEIDAENRLLADILHL